MNIVGRDRFIKFMRYWFALLFFTVYTVEGLSQELPTYTHYYSNPYIYNPAFAGIEGRPTISLTHRRQWLGIEDAPITSNFTFHTPVIAGLNLGLNITQDNYGIFQTSGGLLSLGYKVQLGFNQYFTFGLSGGAKYQNVDLSDPSINLNDPAIVKILGFEKAAKLDGNAGVAYHIAGLTVGFSLQNIFNTSTFPTETFETGSLGLIRNYIISGDYMLYFGNDDYIFQPYGSYKSFEGYGTQFEAGAIFHVKHALWIGGSYRQDFGIIGILGIKIKDSFSVAYAYEMPTTKANNINKTSHEIQLNLAFGKKKERAKKYTTFLASHKPIKPKKEKKPKKEEPEEEDPVIVEEAVEEELEEKTPESVLDSLSQGGNKIRLIIENSPPEPINNTDTATTESPVAIVQPPTSQKEDLKPAVITKKGNHPFEMDRGHYIIIGAYGVPGNAIRMNDKLLSQGYNSDFGFNSDKKLFYVFIRSADSAEAARAERDEIRKNPSFSSAWYLLVE